MPISLNFTVCICAVAIHFVVFTPNTTLSTNHLSVSITPVVSGEKPNSDYRFGGVSEKCNSNLIGRKVRKKRITRKKFEPHTIKCVPKTDASFTNTSSEGRSAV